VRVITTGLQVPWDVAFLPDGRALVTERPGRVRLVSAAGELRDEPVARVPVQALGEGGLMGIALDPAFEDGRPFVYLMATRDDEVRVLRYRWNEERTALTEDGITLDGIQAGAIHDSGRIRFGPDDRLYVVTGDPDRRTFAQERSSLNGNVLSLAPSQYRQSSGVPRIVSIGHATRRAWTGNGQRPAAATRWSPVQVGSGRLTNALPDGTIVSCQSCSGG
jgi:glucose/arabinose dehydrogenase